MNELIAALLLSLPLAQAPDDRIICVPRADGAGWDCGKGVAAPAQTPTPPPVSRSTATAEPPPLYLIDPAQMPRIVRESIERGDYATAEAASEHLPAAPRVVRSADEPAPAEQAPVAATAPVPPPSPAPAAAAATSATPATAVRVVAAPATVEPVAAPHVAQTPEPAAVVAEPAPMEPAPPAVNSPPAVPVAETPAPPAPSPSAPTEATPAVPTAAELAQRPPRSVSSSARDASELLALAPTAYTIQLAAARSFQGFTAFRQTLGVAVEDTFVIQVRRNGETWWLMLWRDFPDLDSARSAAASLPNSGSFWPRRLAPLQAEVRAAQ